MQRLRLYAVEPQIWVLEELGERSRLSDSFQLGTTATLSCARPPTLRHETDAHSKCDWQLDVAQLAKSEVFAVVPVHLTTTRRFKFRDHVRFLSATAAVHPKFMMLATVSLETPGGTRRGSQLLTAPTGPRCLHLCKS